MCRRPSKCAAIEVKASRFLPPDGYFAITFFGKVLVRRKNMELWERDRASRAGKVMLHHEWIHVQQAVSTCNSWLFFYMAYIWYFLCGKPWKYGVKGAYYANPFELEAYMNDDDLSYASGTSGTDGWRVFAKMEAEERVRVSKVFHA